MIAEGQSLRLRLPVETEYARTLRLAVSSIAAIVDFTLEQIEDLKIAVGEAFLMAVGRSDGPNELDFVFHLYEDRIRINIGPLPPITQGHSDPQETYGLMILRAVVDEADFKAIDGGVQLVMVKEKAR